MAQQQSSKLLKSLRPRRGDDEGFTLIELMVVVLVIAILLAIAIPTFLGARERSQDRAAQSNLRNALTAAKVAYSNDGDYSNADEANLGAIEPRLDYVNGTTTSTAEGTISVETAGACSNGVNSTAALCTTSTAPSWSSNACSDTERTPLGSTACEAVSGNTWNTQEVVWLGAVWSDSETCFFILDDSESSGPGTNSGTRYGENTTPSNCTGAMAYPRARAADW